jgi:hypothetical protein
MQSVLGFAAIQGVILSAARKKHGAIRRVVEKIPGAQAGVLNPRAIRKICGRQQADGLLPVTGKRALREVIDMNRI